MRVRGRVVVRVLFGIVEGIDEAGGVRDALDDEDNDED